MDNNSQSINGGEQPMPQNATQSGAQTLQPQNPMQDQAQQTSQNQGQWQSQEQQTNNTNTGQGGKTVNKHVFVWVGNFLFGGLGVDRFLRGQIGIGVCKLLFGWLTLGIWSLVDFIIAVTKAYGSAYHDTEDITFDSTGNYLH